MHIVECAGGVDRYLRMLTSKLNKELFEQILICSNDYNREIYEPYVDKVIQIQEMQNSLSIMNDFAAFRKTRNIVKKELPDIVYCHSSKGGGIGRLACIGLGVKVVYNPHGWAFSMKGSKIKHLLYMLIEKVLAKATDQFVMISNFEKELAINKRITNKGKMQVIFNGVDINEIKENADRTTIKRSQLGIPEDAYIIGMTGRISPQKAPDIFIKTAAEVLKKIPEAYFIIVGDGELKEDIIALAKNNGTYERLLITGWVDNPIPYMNMFDQAVLLSRWEGFGLVLAEFMALNKPIVATNAGAIPDLITNYRNGIIVPIDSPEETATAICELHDNRRLKKGIIQNAYNRVIENYDISRVIKEHEKLFTEIVIHGGCKNATMSSINPHHFNLTHNALKEIE